MTGRTKEVEVTATGTVIGNPDRFFVLQSPHVGDDGKFYCFADDYAPNDADREWVARELGDVPHRNTAEQWTQTELSEVLPAEPYQFNRITDYFGETVPVESLGRDSDV